MQDVVQERSFIVDYYGEISHMILSVLINVFIFLDINLKCMFTVLPRFEVKVNVPSILHYEDTLTGTVTAK